MRVIDAVCLALAVGVAGYVYKVKHEAEIAQDAKLALEREIAIVSRDVHLLEADLAALDHPGRMQTLVSGARDDLVLEPIAARHFVHLSDIPFRSELIADEAEDATENLPVAVGTTQLPVAARGEDGIAGLLAGDGVAPEEASQSLDALLTQILSPEAETAPDDGIAALLEDRQ